MTEILTPTNHPRAIQKNDHFLLFNHPNATHPAHKQPAVRIPPRERKSAFDSTTRIPAEQKQLTNGLEQIFIIEAYRYAIFTRSRTALIPTTGKTFCPVCHPQGSKLITTISIGTWPPISRLSKCQPYWSLDHYDKQSGVDIEKRGLLSKARQGQPSRRKWRGRWLLIVIYGIRAEKSAVKESDGEWMKREKN